MRRCDYPADCEEIRKHARQLGAFWLGAAPLWVVAELWSTYSDEVWAAGWITGYDNRECVDAFIRWVNEQEDGA